MGYTGYIVPEYTYTVCFPDQDIDIKQIKQLYLDNLQNKENDKSQILWQHLSIYILSKTLV